MNSFFAYVYARLGHSSSNRGRERRGGARSARGSPPPPRPPTDVDPAERAGVRGSATFAARRRCRVDGARRRTRVSAPRARRRSRARRRPGHVGATCGCRRVPCVEGRRARDALAPTDGGVSSTPSPAPPPDRSSGAGSARRRGTRDRPRVHGVRTPVACEPCTTARARSATLRRRARAAVVILRERRRGGEVARGRARCAARSRTRSGGRRCADPRCAPCRSRRRRPDGTCVWEPAGHEAESADEILEWSNVARFDIGCTRTRSPVRALWTASSVQHASPIRRARDGVSAWPYSRPQIGVRAMARRPRARSWTRPEPRRCPRELAARARTRSAPARARVPTSADVFGARHLASTSSRAASAAAPANVPLVTGRRCTRRERHVRRAPRARAATATASCSTRRRPPGSGGRAARGGGSASDAELSAWDGGEISQRDAYVRPDPVTGARARLFAMAYARSDDFTCVPGSEAACRRRRRGGAGGRARRAGRGSERRRAPPRASCCGRSRARHPQRPELRKRRERVAAASRAGTTTTSGWAGADCSTGVPKPCSANGLCDAGDGEVRVPRRRRQRSARLDAVRTELAAKGRVKFDGRCICARDEADHSRRGRTR